MKILRIPLVIVLVAMAGRTFYANAQTETNLYSFAGPPTDGQAPYAGLVQGNDGNFYGTTEFGGTNSCSCGTVFQINPSGTYTSLYSFGSYPSDGSTPLAGLVLGSDGNFYGTTHYGGPSSNCDDNDDAYCGYGTVFRISPSGAYASLYQFGSYPNGGYFPQAVLVQGSDGNFYGTTTSGGTNGYGTVFRISPSGTYTSLYSFGSFPTDGENPIDGLVQGSDGDFYGTTTAGGTHGPGTVFRISPSGAYTSLYSFGSYPNDGAQPWAGLVLGSDGNFYGTTKEGGTNTCVCGTVFRISPSGIYTSLYSFGSYPNDGYEPVAGLLQGSDGNFYGTALWGGTNVNGVTDGEDGTVFRITPSGAYVSLYQFGSSPGDGYEPEAGLVQGSDGDLYGTTLLGGTHYISNGTVFKLDVGLGTISMNCTFSIGPTNAVFEAAGGSASVSVTASDGCAWKAISIDSFITITSGVNGFGNGAADYTVAANTSSTGRSGTMQIAGQTFTVTQSGASSGTALIMVLANPSAGGTVSGSGTYTVGSSQQISASANSGFSFVSWSDGGAQTHDITVPSGGATYTANFAATTPTCTYTLSAAGVNLAAKGGLETVSVKAKAGCTWTAASSDSFIRITSVGSGTGNGTVKFTVPGNISTMALTGTITIAGLPFAVTQDSGGCSFALSPKDGKFKDTGGAGTVKVTPNFSDCDWTAVSNDGFITVTAGASGTGKGSVRYTVAANATTVPLIGSITIGGENFVIDEAAAPCELSLGETAASFSSAGGSSNVTVTANGTNCTWTAVVSGTFIQITSGTSGTGSGTVDYTVEANTKTATRKGTITVGKEKLTITQSATP